MGACNTAPELEDLTLTVNSLHIHEQDDTTLEQYEDILSDPYMRLDHRHLEKYYKQMSPSTKKLSGHTKNTYGFKQLQTTGENMRVLRLLEAHIQQRMHGCKH